MVLHELHHRYHPCYVCIHWGCLVLFLRWWWGRHHLVSLQLFQNAHVRCSKVLTHFFRRLFANGHIVKCNFVSNFLHFLTLTFYRANKSDSYTGQMNFHHLVSLFGISVALYVGGLIGSISHLTLITEGSTFFVNLRSLMVYHKYETSMLYTLNGFFMAVSFAIFRIWFYHFMIFSVLVHYVIYRGGSFWSIFYKEKLTQRIVTFAMIMYVFMYFL